MVSVRIRVLQGTLFYVIRQASHALLDLQRVVGESDLKALEDILCMSRKSRVTRGVENTPVVLPSQQINMPKCLPLSTNLLFAPFVHYSGLLLKI